MIPMKFESQNLSPQDRGLIQKAAEGLAEANLRIAELSMIEGDESLEAQDRVIDAWQELEKVRSQAPGKGIGNI